MWKMTEQGPIYPRGRLIGVRNEREKWRGWARLQRVPAVTRIHCGPMSCDGAARTSQSGHAGLMQIPGDCKGDNTAITTYYKQ